MCLDPLGLFFPQCIDLLLELFAHVVDFVTGRVELEAVVEHEIQIGLALVGSRVEAALLLVCDGLQIHRLFDNLAIIWNAQCDRVYGKQEWTGETAV